MELLLPPDVYKSLPLLKDFVKSLWINPEDIKDEDLFLCAFVHKSYAADFKEEYDHNERLEFLWDAILWSIISRKLFLEFPKMPESTMTLYKIALVREENLCKVAKKINLHKQLFISKWEERSWWREKPSITSDALESLIWYISLDIWYSAAQDFVLKYIYPEIEEIPQTSIKSYKTLAQEDIQKEYKKLPIYKDSEAEKDSKNNVLCFRSEIIVNDSVLAVWFWTNKKKAQEDAAKNYIENKNNK